MTPNAEQFRQANARSPVVEGTVIGLGGEGAIYRLQSGRTFTLTAVEVDQVAPIRWKLPTHQEPEHER